MDVQGALAYYHVVKQRLGNTVLLLQFKQTMALAKVPNINPCVIVEKLSYVFRDHPDLLKGFETFLPKSYKDHLITDHGIYPDMLKRAESAHPRSFPPVNSRNLPVPNVAPSSIPDETVSHLAKYESFHQLGFFDKMKKALGYPEVYENFLRCLQLYVDDHITRLELVDCVAPFFSKFPQLLKEFKDILRLREDGENLEPIPYKIANAREVDEETVLDIDYSCGKKLNASYRALPKTFKQPVCSGRTALCDEVLNDTWVSFPAWSEDSAFGATLKTKYDEAMYHIEDERFELDMAIKTNASVIELLSNVQKKILKMSDAEKAAFTLDDTLGGNSSVLNYRFIHRIYGDRTKELMDGLKRNPVVAVPIVLNRLRLREKDWKDVQSKYNVIWRDQTYRMHPKSLDHQGTFFKQNDAKSLRPKTLLNEIETFFEERKQKIVEGSVGGHKGPHITKQLEELHVFNDAVAFIVQDIKKQSGVYKVDRQRIADLMHFFVAVFFNVHPDISSYKEKPNGEQNNNAGADHERSPSPSLARRGSKDVKNCEEDADEVCSLFDEETLTETVGSDAVERFHIATEKYKFMHAMENHIPYSLFYANNTWYIFFRLFSVLMERLSKLYLQSLKMEADQDKSNEPGSSSSSDSKQSPYSVFKSKVIALLNGKLDSSKFEEDMRELYTVHAYISYTIDKVIHGIVKQLHMICNDETCKKCLTVHAAHLIKLQDISSESLVLQAEHSYEKKVVQILEEENCYKIVWGKAKNILAIELLDNSNQFVAEEPPGNPDMSDYLDTFTEDDYVLIKEIPKTVDHMPVILPRTLRKQWKYWEKKRNNKSSDSSTPLKGEPIKFRASPVTRKVVWQTHPKFIHSKYQLQQKRKLEMSDTDSAYQAPSPKRKTIENKPKPASKEVTHSEETAAKCTKKVNTRKSSKVCATDLQDAKCSETQSDSKIRKTCGKEISHVENKDNGAEESCGSNRKQGRKKGKTAAGETQSDADDDCIKVSAADLRFHLAQTGMSFVTRYTNILERSSRSSSRSLKSSNSSSSASSSSKSTSPATSKPASPAATKTVHITTKTKKVVPATTRKVPVTATKRAIATLSKRALSVAAKRVVPEATKRVAPEAAKKVVPGVAKRVAPEAAKKVVPEVTKRVAPEVAKRIVPETAKRVVPEVAKRAVPAVTRKAKQEPAKNESDAEPESNASSKRDIQDPEKQNRTTGSQNGRKTTFYESKHGHQGFKVRVLSRERRQQKVNPPGVFVPTKPFLTDETDEQQPDSENSEPLFAIQKIHSLFPGENSKVKVTFKQYNGRIDPLLLKEEDFAYDGKGISEEALSKFLNESKVPAVQKACSSEALSEGDSDCEYEETVLCTLKKCYEFALQKTIYYNNITFVFDCETSKLDFSKGTEDYFYRKGSLLKANIKHRDYSGHVNQKFDTWHCGWLEQNVTAAMLKCCNDWLMRCDLAKYRVDCVTINEKVRPPYNPYSKYFIRRYSKRRCHH